MNGQIIVYFQDGDAYVDIGNGYLLCIGTLEEVSKANSTQVVDMVNAAIALNKYRGIDTEVGVIKH